MPLSPTMARSIDELRARAGELFDRARGETTDQLAQFSGRSASWVDEAGRSVADNAVTMTEQLTEAAGQRVERLADRLAGTVCQWTEGLGDRMVKLGEELAKPRPTERG